MGLLERIYALSHKNTDNFNNSNYLTDSIKISINELALNQPIKFILKYLNQETIDRALRVNPNIGQILKENHLGLNYNLNNVKSIIMSHLIPTSKVAKSIYLKLGHKKTEDSYIYLVQGALLHDIGKIFIPEEILNKKGKLTKKERSIIELHNRLSYEILKTTDLNPAVIKLALEHHDYDKNIKRTQENQTLTVADVYCALREARPYKKPINFIGAKTILYDMAAKGQFDISYISYI